MESKKLKMQMKLIYVCSKFKGNIKLNINKAKVFSQYIYNIEKQLPLCVHLFLDKAINLKEIKENRKRLLETSLKYLERADEIWVYVNDVISEGMWIEINYAKKEGMPIRFFS